MFVDFNPIIVLFLTAIKDSTGKIIGFQSYYSLISNNIYYIYEPADVVFQSYYSLISNTKKSTVTANVTRFQSYYSLISNMKLKK